LLNRKGQRGNVYQAHYLIISKNGIHEHRRMVVFGLTFKVERGDVKQFLSAGAQRNR
jgi:hypothetical protein